jgi:hypothetical protein
MLELLRKLFHKGNRALKNTRGAANVYVNNLEQTFEQLTER